MKCLAGIFAIFFLNISIAAAATVTLRLGHIAEVDNPYALGAIHFAELVQKQSKGQMVISVHPAGELGSQSDLIQGIADGTVDMALTSSAVLANYVPEIALFDLPFLFRDRQHAYKALDTIGMELSRKGESRGIITLAFWENGIRQMTNNVRPIANPQDMKGLRMRVMEQPICIEMMKILGARPIPMSITELYDALKNNIVDGQENPLAHVATKHYYEVQKYLSLTSHTYTAEPLLFSIKTWHKLTPEQQKILTEAANETRDWQRALCVDQEKNFLQVIRESGKCQIIEEIDKEAFRKATHATWEIYSNLFGNTDLKRVVELQ